MSAAGHLRALTPRQAATRNGLRDAAIALVSREPFDDVTMRDIAREAGVSPATAYTYYGSKEHVLAEAYVEFVESLTDRLRIRPPGGSSVLHRVRSVIRRATSGVSDAPELAAAFTRAMASSDASVAMIRPRVEHAFRDWLDLAIGATELDDRDAIVRTLELVLYASMVARANGQMTTDEMRATLDDTARLLLADVGCASTR